MRMGKVGMVAAFLVIALVIVLRGLAVMLRRLGVMLRGRFMMFTALVIRAHRLVLGCEGVARPRLRQPSDSRLTVS